MLAKTILKRIQHFWSRAMKFSEPLAVLSSAILLAVLLTGCSTPWGGTDKPVPLVILDTDIGSSTDDLFALEMLFRYEEAGKCRLLGVVVDRPIDIPEKHVTKLTDGEELTTYEFKPLLGETGKPVIRAITEADIDALGEAVMDTILFG